MKRLILASGSPRRKQLLTQASLSFDISVSKVDESINEHQTPAEAVQTLALRKAKKVARRYTDAVVLGADTVVSIDGTILGKPKNKDDARAMLQRLSGRVHTVYTGTAIVSTEQTLSFYAGTEVLFWELAEDEIEAYISSGEPFDKAGSYGIQGLGATLVKEIHGDYFTVVGLPLSRTVRALRNFGITTRSVTEKKSGEEEEGGTTTTYDP
ncbi:MAG TPA: Maf family protein [Bacillales bacterium]|nr:Maf family protein [Bacillales bacterium]